MTLRKQRGAERSTGVFAEKHITIRTSAGARYMRVSPKAQVAVTAVGLVLAGWMIASTTTLGLMAVDRMAGGDHLAAEADGYRLRVSELASERDALRAKAAELEARLAAAKRDLTERQARVVDAAQTETELSIAVSALRTKLENAAAERDAALAARRAGDARAEAAEARAARAEADIDGLKATMNALTARLETAVAERDAAVASADALDIRIAALETERRVGENRRQRVAGQLEDAVAVGLSELDKVFRRAGVDFDGIMDDVRREYSGAGGPFIPVDASFDAGGAGGAGGEVRLASLVDDLERVQLMRIAVAKMPLARPIRASYRLTSGFGIRRDPRTGRAREHRGLDLAGPRGTPIYSTADGVVAFAGRQAGYGNVIKVRHAFGFETVYAHLSRIRVKPGERVARGDRIGDMGSTGRSTGSHLHYEVRVNGTAVNPQKYLEAARNVL